MVSCDPVVLEAGVMGGKCTSKSFDMLKIQAKSLNLGKIPENSNKIPKYLGKILENLGKNGTQHCLT